LIGGWEAWYSRANRFSCTSSVLGLRIGIDTEAAGPAARRRTDDNAGRDAVGAAPTSWRPRARCRSAPSWIEFCCSCWGRAAGTE